VSVAAVIAANRFGFGARPGELAKISNDARGWLLAQIRLQPKLQFDSSKSRLTQLLGAVNDPRKLAEALRAGLPLYREDIVTRTLHSVTTPSSFAERWVQFWSNHLAVSVDRPQVAPVAALYENEAIRPHAFGRFSDMLLASAQHPGMLLYLDNVRSIGPNSAGARLRNRRREDGEQVGLNENYAREVMELHTVGVNGGYDQGDVTRLAKILTGWSFARGEGTYAFRALAHEPGAQVVMGRSFAQEGEAQGVAALTFLAMHPATARHLASKLVRHFVADTPTEADIASIATVFERSGGNLAEVARAIVSLESAWQPQPVKYKSPHEHVISTLRAIGVKTLDDKILASYEVLGQRAFGAPSPQGWPDTEDKWLSGESLLRRIEWSHTLAQRLPATLDARKIAAEALGPWLSGDTQFVLQGAPSGKDALALFFLAPEFQRR
jgi:uncharacterized protein (DUF1800 family)